ncbi:hypothetical protein DPMN_142024 [Dreissena polymorpha]|uniref:Uncharacterized protein n=1 Tax=Dreissena polymorpha TaxID=45954 RepID=A0A9D4GAW0_DREPO|nr:hypothetical protein DPMN_142024 [Dreissena polymorpha]
MMLKDCLHVTLHSGLLWVLPEHKTVIMSFSTVICYGYFQSTRLAVIMSLCTVVCYGYFQSTRLLSCLSAQWFAVGTSRAQGCYNVFQHSGLLRVLPEHKTVTMSLSTVVCYGFFQSPRLLPCHLAQWFATGSSRAQDCYHVTQHSGLLRVLPEHKTVTMSLSTVVCYGFFQSTRLLPCHSAQWFATGTSRAQDCYHVTQHSGLLRVLPEHKTVIMSLSTVVCYGFFQSTRLLPCHSAQWFATDTSRAQDCYHVFQHSGLLRVLPEHKTVIMSFSTVVCYGYFQSTRLLPCHSAQWFATGTSRAQDCYHVTLHSGLLRVLPEHKTVIMSFSSGLLRILSEHKAVL